MPDTPRRTSRTWKIVAVVALLVAWTALANSWTDKGCGLPQSYSLVIQHGTPDHTEGCETEPTGPTYTDNYYR